MNFKFIHVKYRPLLYCGSRLKMLMNKNNEKPNNVREEVDEKITSNKVEKLEKEINSLKSDVKTLSDELKSVVAELKKSIVDVRSAISEIENPFNLLRAISSEEELKKLTQEGEITPPVEVKSIFIGKPEETEAEAPSKVESTTLGEPKKVEKEEVETEEIKKSKKAPQPEELRKTSQEEIKEEVKGMEAPTKSYFPLRFGARYLEWVWSLLNSGFNASEISGIAEFYEYLGYLPAGFGKKVSLIASALRKAKSGEASKIELLLNMYKTAVLSGVKITSDDQYVLFSIIESAIKRASELKNRRDGK